jgi:hypothetical protein
MSDLRAIKLLRSLLCQRDKWTLDCVCPDGFDEMGEKAESYASKRISNMSLISIWTRYQSWRKTEPMIRNSDDYFHAFISDMAYKLTSKHLKDKIFDDHYYFQFRFI